MVRKVRPARLVKKGIHAEMARITGQEIQAVRAGIPARLAVEGRRVQLGRAGKPGRHCRTCSPVRKCRARQIVLAGRTGQAG